jgi:excisionase family DNA binding protein
MVAAGGVVLETELGEAAEARPYYSVSEVAALLGVSRVSVWRWISSGRLPVTRLGHRTVRIRREDLNQLIRPTHASASRGQQPDASSSPGPHTSGMLASGGLASVALGGLQAAERHWVEVDGGHTVVFYDQEPFLLDSVTEFFAPGLRADDLCVLVATPDHRARVEARLEAGGIHLDQARGAGRYVAVDAAEMLSRFMVGDTPDPGRFSQAALGYLELARGRRVRIFGEMVALLLAAGSEQAALRLEALWNDLQQRHAFSLLCGYGIQQFGSDGLGSALASACAQHACVVPAESYSAQPDADARLRQVAMLQQKAAALEAEVAERKRVQEQLQLALAAERAARDAAETALRSRNEFLSIASHELRTPITVLGAQAQLSLRRLERTGQLEPERVVQALRTVGSQAHKLSRLVGQLLDVARLDSGRLTIQREPTDLVALIDQVVASSRSLAANHTLSLTAPAEIEGEFDSLRLEQVFTNVLDNAIKYSPEGGLVEVSVSQPSPECAVVSVRDHGLGIPLDKRSRIFERFFQAHENGNTSGMGLGLYVSRQIVELHGGHIRAEFPDGGGTRVVVELPLGSAPRAAISAAEAYGPGSTRARLYIHGEELPGAV